MALFRCGASSDNYIYWAGAHATANSAFVDAEDNVLEVTGGTFSDKYGISVAYTSNDIFTVTNNTGADLFYISNTNEGFTHGIIANGTNQSVRLPVLAIKA